MNRWIWVSLWVLAAVACRAEQEVEGPRTLRAPRTTAQSGPAPARPPQQEAAPEGAGALPGAAPGEQSGPPDEIVEAVLGVLEGVRDGRRDDDARAGYEDQLNTAMADTSYCRPQRRGRVAAEIVTAIVDADAKRSLTGVLQEQMWRLAEGFSRDLSLRCGDDLPRAGTVTMLPPLKPPPGYAPLDWAVLKGYEFQAGVALPAAVTALAGKRAINGYMIPLSTEARPREFVLVGALWDCCFGKPPALNHGVIVSFPAGAAYTDFPVLVIGEFEVGEEREDGVVTSVYRLRATTVQPQTL